VAAAFYPLKVQRCGHRRRKRAKRLKRRGQGVCSCTAGRRWLRWRWCAGCVAERQRGTRASCGGGVVWSDDLDEEVVAFL